MKRTDKISDSIEQLARDSNFSGVISVKRGDETVYSGAFGYRDIKNRVPNSITTRFGIASGTKLFTALGIGKLIESGDISLTTTVKEIDGSFEGFVDGRATILELLTHSSGIYDYFDEDQITDFETYTVEIPWSDLETPSDYLPLFKNRKSKFSPGDQYSYSNGGFVFLGIIIETITGQLYRDFISENVLQPAGMHDSGFYAFDDLPENTSSGYLEDLNTTNIYRLPIRGGGDGGMYTTAEDLHRFWRSLVSFKILSQKLTSTYLKTHREFDHIDGYGCGIYKKLDESRFSILGCDAGVGFFSTYVVADKTTISVLSNMTNGENSIVDLIISGIANGW